MQPYTTLGEGGRQFPHTTWSLVAQLQGEAGDRRVGFDKLCARYWRPIYFYVCQGFRKSNDDAKDLTQAFFLWLVEGDVLDKYTPERSSFRFYLKGLLRNYMSNHEQALRRLKRGGGQSPLPLEDELRSLGDLVPDARAESPEDAFDAAWVDGLIERALERMRESLVAEGREQQLRAYEAYELGPPGSKPTYTSVAEELGLKVTDVRNYLFAARERLREEIRNELRDTVSSPEQLEEEWRVVFGDRSS